MAFTYGPEHRSLQDRFDTRRLADTMAEVVIHDTLTPEDQAFITARDMCWIATVDAAGNPTVSYKGGAPGFVAVLDAETLAMPCYDGNGMYLSMGNIAAHPQVGLLFMDLEKPFRLRVQGTATLEDDPALLARFPGAQFVVRIAVGTAFPNCPRYVHKHARVADSRYVPDAAGASPLPGWKRIDFMQPALPHYDTEKVAPAGGTIRIDEWLGQVAEGDPNA